MVRVTGLEIAFEAFTRLRKVPKARINTGFLAIPVVINFHELSFVFIGFNRNHDQIMTTNFSVMKHRRHFYSKLIFKQITLNLIASTNTDLSLSYGLIRRTHSMYYSISNIVSSCRNTSCPSRQVPSKKPGSRFHSDRPL